MEAVSDRPRRPDLIACAVIAVVAIALFIAAIPWGIGIRPDSAYYLGFPYYLQGQSPAYAWAINLVAATGLDRIMSATVLNAGFLLLNALLVYGLARGYGATVLISTVAAILLLTSPLVFELHVTVLSEPMFIFLMLLTLALLSLYAGSGALHLLLLAGLVSVLFFLTRFNGAPVWVVGALTALFLGPKHTRTRLIHAVAFIAAVVLPLFVWGLIEARTGGTGLGREFGFLGNATLDVLVQGASSIWVSFFPNVVPDVVKIAASLALIAALAVLVWHMTMRRVVATPRDAADPFAAFPLLAGVYILGHFALLLLSLLIEPNLPLKPSYFAPVYTLLVVIGAQYTRYLYLSDAGGARVLRIGLMSFAVLVLASNLARTGKLITEYRAEGIFFASPQWYDSPLVAEINALEPDIFVYTNAPDVVHLLTGYDTEWLPMKFNRRTGKPLPDRPYETWLADMQSDLEQGKAVLAFFDRVTWRFYLPTQDELTRTLNLQELVRVQDGTLMHLSPE